MKKRNFFCLILIVACLAVFFGYRTVDRLRTDTKPPEILISEELPTVSVHDPESALLAGVTATDNRDGDVTDTLVVESVKLTGSDGTIRVSLAAFDQSGNVAKSERSLQYTDYHSPTFTLSAPLAFVQNSSFEVLDIIHAEDMLDGDISSRIRATSLDTVSIASPGIHDIQFSVTNSLGETTALVLPVDVYISRQYSAKLTLTDYLVYLPRGTAFDAYDYLDEFTAGTKTTSLRYGVPADLTLDIAGTVNTQTPGVYSVSYTVTNSYYTGYSRLIVVVEE